MFKISKDTTATWCRSGVFILTFEHISHLFIVFLLLTLSKLIPADSSLFGAIFMTLSDINDGTRLQK